MIIGLFKELKACLEIPLRHPNLSETCDVWCLILSWNAYDSESETLQKENHLWLEEKKLDSGAKYMTRDCDVDK